MAVTDRPGSIPFPASTRWTQGTPVALPMGACQAMSLARQNTVGRKAMSEPADAWRWHFGWGFFDRLVSHFLCPTSYLVHSYNMPEQTSRRVSSSGNGSGALHSPTNWTLPNNAVAESDLEAALQAIAATFQEATTTRTGMDEIDEETRTMLFQEIQQSLMHHVKRIVQPIADFDYQDYLDLYHVVPPGDEDDEDDDLDENESYMKDDSNDDDKVEEGEEEEEEEIDEADLLDTKALQEAQQLRSIVRELAKNVQDIREQVLKDSVETIVKQDYYSTLVESIADRPSFEMDHAVIEEQQEFLQKSLQTLSTLLKDSRWNQLPHQLHSLHNTIEAIQVETNKDLPMSQTEAAIISRTNSIDDIDGQKWEMILSSQRGEQGEELSMTASDRLARYFACFQE